MSQIAHVEVDVLRKPKLEVNPLPQLVPVAEGYERWAPTYDDEPNPLLAREERYFAPILNTLNFTSVLDLACGTGRWLNKLLARSGTTGFGVDLSAAMLRIAHRKDGINGRLTQATCEHLPFAAAKFDLAICSFAWSHLRDIESALRELNRVTKPGANVFLSDLHPEAYQRGWRVGFRDGRASVQIEAAPHSADEILAVFSANRFECLSQKALWLGKPEEPLFFRAGRSHSFLEACKRPAVLVCHFRRIE